MRKKTNCSDPAGQAISRRLFLSGCAACSASRTKLCAEPVGDMEKLFTMWDRWGWHRVTFYGDLKKPVYALADAMDWSVVEEA